MRAGREMGLANLFGSATRASILSVLANASRPLTGYRVAQVSRNQRIKVSAELRNLRELGLVREVLIDRDREGWVLLDPDLQRFFRRRFPIVWSEDLIRESEDRARRTRILAARFSAMPAVNLTAGARWRPRNLRLYRRPKEKDEALESLSLRISGRRRRDR